MHKLIAALLVALPIATQAQVYKCTEAGKTVFSDRPCAADDVPVQVRPATGAFDPAAARAAEERAARDLADLQRIELQRQNVRQREAEAAAARRQGEQDSCAKIREDMEKAYYWAGEFRHPDNVRRERDKAKSLEDRLWWDCKQTR